MSFFLLANAWSQNAQATENIIINVDDQTITWHTFEAPPLIILKGKHKDSGIVDGLRNLLKTQISDYKHIEETLPYKRFLLYAKKGKNICTPYLYKNAEREKFLTFSKPAIIFPSVQAIMHKDTYVKLGTPSEISIKQLFQSKYRLSTNKIRSYGDKINPIIEQYEREGLVTRHTGSTTLVFRLIARKRTDFMIDYSNRILYWAKERDLDPNDFQSVPIIEDRDSVISYVACPKTAWGGKVISHVNSALDEVVPKNGFLNILQRWSQGFHKELIEHLYQNILMKHYK